MEQPQRQLGQACLPIDGRPRTATVTKNPLGVSLGLPSRPAGSLLMGVSGMARCAIPNGAQRRAPMEDRWASLEKCDRIADSTSGWAPPGPAASWSGAARSGRRRGDLSVRPGSTGIQLLPASIEGWASQARVSSGAPRTAAASRRRRRGSARACSPEGRRAPCSFYSFFSQP